MNTTTTTATTVVDIIHEEIERVLGIDHLDVLQEVKRQLMVHPTGGEMDLEQGLSQESNMLKVVRKGIEGLNMDRLYYISRGVDSPRNNSKIIGEVIPKIVRGFLSSVPYLEKLIAVSDDLYKMVKPYSNEYPNLVKGLYFLQNLRFDLQNRHYIPKVSMDSYYYPAIIATDDPQDTKEQWLDIIDNMLSDLQDKDLQQSDNV